MKFITVPLMGFFVFLLLFLCTSLSYAKPISLVSVKVTIPPKLDGGGQDDAWSSAKSVEVEAEDGPEISIKTVYTNNKLYFRLAWSDWTESVSMDKWIYDGNKWRVKEELRWEDEPPWEADTDRFCFQWPIKDEVLIKKFSKKGCSILCHKPEKENKMYTNKANQKSDIWQWRASITNPLGYADDGFLDHTNVSKNDETNADKRINAAHKWDVVGANGSSYQRNRKGNGPKWMSSTQTPFLVKGQEVPLDMSKVVEGKSIPGWILARPNGSRGNIDAAAKYNQVNKSWTLELSRDLTTKDKNHDVQFDDLSKVYYFGIAVWENDRLYGHARVRKPLALTFD